MNVTFAFAKDKSLIREDLVPYRIVSLWDMLSLNAEAFAKVCLRLASANGILFVGTRIPIADAIISADEATNLIKILGLVNLSQDLHDLDLHLTKMTADKLMTMLAESQGVQAKLVEETVRESIVGFKDELRGRYF